MLRRNFMCGAKMDFRYLAQYAWPVRFYEFFGGLFYAWRYAPFQSQAELLAPAFQPIDEPLARDDRCGRHRDVGFRSRPLLQHNVASMPHQGLLDYTRVRELVR